MKTKQFGLIIDSRLENIPKVSTAVNNFCSQIPLNSEEIYGIELCITEAVVNSIKHAYGSTPGNHVEVELTVYPDYLEIKVRDKGQSMSPSQLEENRGSLKEFKATDIATIPTSGRGLMIISSIMDDVSYCTENNCNSLIMTKSFRVD
jgi:serine/threonine-protein kinase RsbW